MPQYKVINKKGDLLAYVDADSEAAAVKYVKSSCHDADAAIEVQEAMERERT